MDPRSGVLECLLALGRDDEADELEKALRRASAQGDWRGAFHEVVAETLELAGRPHQAHRWFNIGVRDIDLEDPDVGATSCLYGRYRVRRDLGLARDSLDVFADEFREHSRVH
jgi:hypothetical protein